MLRDAFTARWAADALTARWAADAFTARWAADAFTARWAADGPRLPGDALGRHRARTPGILGWELDPDE
ncbi:uncharacterized protein SOCEGT47_073290 [Sorangium cellulosum]|uniref:Uncharacterized protein n=1 Tax=Sorangium cellulosum TaxID=56 RepID=A0A4P2QAZ8_SORCE|nr:hypothetical protein [Sorangium cellulosum]AUX26759.1 uncharacterized protein SOCEGT47_073290 [Sorangium cellulosum]